MTLALVIYNNPVSEWFWESGVAPWVIGAAIVLFVAFLVLLYSGDRRD